MSRKLNFEFITLSYVNLGTSKIGITFALATGTPITGEYLFNTTSVSRIITFFEDTTQLFE